jgi:hypothetical protein
MTTDHISALEWGQAHGSCWEALEWRRGLGPEATQADAWRLCQLGDWLIWQWGRLPVDAQHRTEPAMRRAVDRIVARAIRRGVRSLRGNREPWAREWRAWARAWLDGSDRSEGAAWGEAWAAEATEAATAAAAAAWGAAAWAAEAPEAAARAAAWAAEAPEAAAERSLQARDIRAEIPEWPWEA